MYAEISRFDNVVSFFSVCALEISEFDAFVSRKPISRVVRWRHVTFGLAKFAYFPTDEAPRHPENYPILDTSGMSMESFPFRILQYFPL